MLFHSPFQIKYEADPEGGFRILEGSTLGPAQPRDTKAVEKATAEHEALFRNIAAAHAAAAESPAFSQPEDALLDPVDAIEAVEAVAAAQAAAAPQDTVAVQKKRQEQADLYRKITEQHRKIAEQHERLAAQRARQPIPHE